MMISRIRRILASVLAVVCMVFVGALVAPSASAAESSGTIDPNHYVGDDSKVLNDSTKMLVTGLNVKYSGYRDPISLVLVTRSGMNPAADMTDYQNGLFDYLKVGSNNPSGRNLGIMLLMMPDSGYHTVVLGDGITGNLRDALKPSALFGTNVSSYMNNGNWNAAARTMVALVDARITAAENGDVVINKTVAPMTAAESKANERMYRVKEAASKSQIASNLTILAIVLMFLVVLSLVLLMFIMSDRRRRNASRLARYGMIRQYLDAEHFMDNPGIDDTNSDTIIRDIDKAIPYRVSQSAVVSAAHALYEKNILPEVMAHAGAYGVQEYQQYIGTIPNRDRLLWWSSYGINPDDIRSEADESIAASQRKRFARTQVAG